MPARHLGVAKKSPMTDPTAGSRPSLVTGSIPPSSAVTPRPLRPAPLVAPATGTRGGRHGPPREREGHVFFGILHARPWGV